MGLQDERFYEWDLTEELAELELNYVPVEACNELMGMQSELTDKMIKIFDRMDMVCSNGNLQMKYKAIDELESLPLFYLLKYECVYGRAFTRCYKKIDTSYRDLLDYDSDDIQQSDKLDDSGKLGTSGKLGKLDDKLGKLGDTQQNDKLDTIGILEPKLVDPILDILEAYVRKNESLERGESLGERTIYLDDGTRVSLRIDIGGGF